MPDLKPLSHEAVPAAIEKALRYRLLNEPAEAESICLDVLEVEPDNEHALVTLVLSLTDQLERHRPGLVYEIRDALARIENEYQRAYYSGIATEREAKAHFARGGPGCGHGTFELLHAAMEWFDRAAAIRPAGNDEAILRWNACARFLDRHPEIKAAPTEPVQPFIE